MQAKKGEFDMRKNSSFHYTAKIHLLGVND